MNYWYFSEGDGTGRGTTRSLVEGVEQELEPLGALMEEKEHELELLWTFRGSDSSTDTSS